MIITYKLYITNETTSNNNQQVKNQIVEPFNPAENIKICMKLLEFPQRYKKELKSTLNLLFGVKPSEKTRLPGKKVLIFGYSVVGKGSCQSMNASGARVYIAKVDPICALQACIEEYKIIRIEDVIDQVEIFITATGNKDIIKAEHMAKINNAIVGNIVHFDN